MGKFDNFKFNNDENFLILLTEQRYNKTSSGKSFKSKPYETKKEITKSVNYQNYITSISWFNNFGGYSSSKAKCNYTIAGYIPTEITTISYDGNEKIIRSFKFIDKTELLKNAGYREQNVIENATNFEYTITSEHWRLELINSNDNTSATIDLKYNNWVN